MEEGVIRRCLFVLLAVLVQAAALSLPAGATEPSRASALVDDAVARAGVRAASSTLPVVITGRDSKGRVYVRRHVVTSKAAADKAVAAADDHGDVVSVEVDGRASIDDLATDPMRSMQWALDDTTYEKAWPTSSGSGVVVAVVDTGVKADHQDLAGAVLPGATFLDGTGTGTTGVTVDANGHGTHVAGIIAARANNGFGVAGGAPAAKILPVRVLDSTGTGWWSDIAKGIYWATDHGAKVINLSLGADSPSDTILSAIRYAKAHDVVIVAAAGNEGDKGNAPNWPASYSEVLAVAAVDKGNLHAWFSNTGSYVDLAAPGVDILSLGTGSTSSYVSMSGTSMATPYVVAAAALVRAAKPSATADQVRTALESTAIDLGASGVDAQYGKGLVDPFAAVRAVGSLAPSKPTPVVVPPPVTSPK